MRGVFSRLRLLEWIPPSPEGVTLSELHRLMRGFLSRGRRVFVLSYHSSSLLPGSTEYVRSQSDLSGFLSRIEGFLDFFIGELGGVSMTPSELRSRFATAAAAPPFVAARTTAPLRPQPCSARPAVLGSETSEGQFVTGGKALVIGDDTRSFLAIVRSLGRAGHNSTRRRRISVRPLCALDTSPPSAICLPGWGMAPSGWPPSPNCCASAL